MRWRRKGFPSLCASLLAELSLLGKALRELASVLGRQPDPRDGLSEVDHHGAVVRIVRDGDADLALVVGVQLAVGILAGRPEAWDTLRLDAPLAHADAAFSRRWWIGGKSSGATLLAISSACCGV